MKEKIDCFLPCSNLDEMDSTLSQIRGARMINRIFLLVNEDEVPAEVPSDITFVTMDRIQSEDTMRKIAQLSTAAYTLLYTKDLPLTLGLYTTRRMVRVAKDTHAAMVYGDRYSIEQGQVVKHPVIDYQVGSIRDDFDFGSLLLIRTSLLHQWAEEMPVANYRYAGWYALRLFLSRQGTLFHLNEYLYTEEERDLRASGEKQFDYVNPANREVQIEMEKAATVHLQAIGATVNVSDYKTPDFSEQDFTNEASVIIPVFNREKTIADAVKSALSQQTTFPYNVIVVDNHSTDQTTSILDTLRKEDERLIHIVPDRYDLGIGGCWNVAVNDQHCGRFAVQLDSDDLYSSPHTLQKIVDAFYQQQAAMIVGSYRMCDFNLNTLPPGLISHAEWTDENGPNNALRINGLGAPRAFFTPLLRQICFPNTSYGEDYALGLAFSRCYKIGRIYEELYLCRRWGGNSDA
ncbi:MAG: glycosyltransferase family 2 protein, partial [Prevotella sp.]|nr:glycosyltransferase family 2 protein [Prevotella sp.]